MMNRVFTIATFYCLLIIGLIIPLSWLVGLIGLPVYSMLSPRGLMLMTQIFQTPIMSGAMIHAVFLLVAVGIIRESGLWRSVRNIMRSGGRGTQLQVLSLRIAGLTFMLMVGVVLMLCVPRDGVLRGVDGSLLHSPLSHIFIVILSSILIVSGVIYGLVCGRFRSIGDCLSALHKGIASYPSVLIFVPSATFLLYICYYVFIA